jgi:error-prone DNA polymerase
MGYYPPHVLVAEARRSGVEIMPPDINRSSDRYTCDGGSIRISLAQLKGMSGGALESIMTQREEGEFTSLRDFVLRTRVSQAIVENLIRVGAFDSLGNSEEMLSELPGLVALSHKVGKGAKSLIDEDANIETGVIQADLYIDKRMRMLAERELLSLDLSAHPLDFYHFDSGFTRIKDLPFATTGRAVKLAGSVIRYQTPPTRNGNRVLYIIMEDGTGVADVTVFGDVQEKCGPVLFREGWLIVEGKVQRRGPKALSIIAENLSPLKLW